MESFSRIFHDDDNTPNPSASHQLDGHARHASIRRLDAMMNYIIRENSGFDNRETKLLKNAFYAQQERIHWAPPALQKQPLKLLLGALLVQVQMRPIAPKFMVEKKRFISHFLQVQITVP